MYRAAMEQLFMWKQKKNKKPLIIRGARQVGKTWLMKEFGRTAYKETVYVSFDIDALDPALCPNTGTPVPGGLSFNQAVLLLDVLKRSGRRVVGFDVVEVSPGPRGGPEIDAITGARILYKLCGVTTP